MDEYILATIMWGNKAITLEHVEPLAYARSPASSTWNEINVKPE